jgi:hypothetical protein
MANVHTIFREIEPVGTKDETGDTPHTYTTTDSIVIS